jgi:RHS repeat-associated protein
LVTINTPAKTLTYNYDATGKKLERITKLGVTVTDDRVYDDGIEYDNNAIEFVHSPEGRAVSNLVGGFVLQYEITDHLGNTRAVITDANGNGVLATNGIVQMTDYYAFGREIAYSLSVSPSPDNKYKYNGKELQVDLGEYDYGARFYDPVIARWNVVDPKAEQYRRWSPYNYCVDNPIRFVDPDGMGVKPGDLFKTVDAAAKDFASYYNGTSIMQNKEFASSIYKVETESGTYYSYTPSGD